MALAAASVQAEQTDSGSTTDDDVHLAGHGEEEEDEEDDEEQDNILLSGSIRVFHHQVAGHFPLFASKEVVCKPVRGSEAVFYTDVERRLPQLAPFVPKFYGVRRHEELRILAEQHEHKEPTAAASSSSSAAAAAAAVAAVDQPKTGKKRVRDEDASLRSTRVRLRSSNVRPTSSPASDSDVGTNDWAARCHERRGEELANPEMQFVVLENLTNGFEHPSVLDLKIGTQQHSAADPPHKVRSKQRRCQLTTSAKVGLRFGGSQVFLPHEQQYVFRDKYFGRKLDEQGLHRALAEFFFDGSALRSDVIRQFLQRVHDFRAVMAEPMQFQFHSSSLLLVYEGEQPASDSSAAGAAAAAAASCQTTAPRLYFIDFAATDFADEPTVNDGNLFGVDNLIALFKDMLENGDKWSSLLKASAEEQ